MTDEFEPYLARNQFGTTAAQIRGFAETTTPANTSLSTILDELDTSRSQVRSTIDGAPAEPTEQNVTTLSTRTRNTHRRGITFAAAMEYLADKVEAHDSDINGLATNHPEAEPDEARELARPINDRLDGQGDDVAALLDGDPDADLTVKDLILNGYIPLGAADYWPNVNANLTDAEKRQHYRSVVGRMSEEERTEFIQSLLDDPEAAADDLPYLPVSIREELGRAVADGVEDNNIATEKTWEQLRYFSLDQEVTGAFVAALGADRMARFVAHRGLQYNEDGDIVEVDDDEAHSRFVYTGYTMAGASRDGVIDRDFLQYFDPNYHGTGMNPQLLGDLMQYGDWDKDALKTIGEVALDGDMTTTGGPGTVADGRAHIFKGISFNVEAAAEFYGENFDDLVHYGTEDSLCTDVGDQDFADFLRTATVTADSHYERMQLDNPDAENLAESNTLRLLEWQHDNQDTHVTADAQTVYGEIIGHYQDDVTASVTSPVPEYFEESDPNRDGIEASDDKWAALLQEGMRNPDVAAGLSIDFKNEVQGMVDDAQREDGPPNSNNFSIAQAGHLEDWFASNFQQTSSEVSDEVDDYNQKVDKALARVYDYAWSTGESAATGNPVPLIKELGKDGVGLVSGLLHKDAPDYSDVDTEWVDNFSSDWRSTVANKFESGQVEPVTVDGITWEGDPAFYEELYDGTFTDGNGDILPFDEMDTDAKRAYNEWLDDPAVQNAAYDDWAARHVGGIPSPTS